MSPDPSRSLADAVVAVIGVTGGLGSAIAAELAGRGATVIGASRTPPSDAPVSGPVSDPVNGGPPVAAHLALDLRNPDAGDQLAALARERFGRLDGVVNAAGIVAFGDLLDTDDVVIEEVFLTDVLGPLWMMKRTAPLIAESRGFICNISAVVAETPMPSMAAYSAAKAALAAAAVALRRELRRIGVQVIDARPPHTETGLAARPLAGTAPRLPEGLAPQTVAQRIVAGIESGETDISSAQFT